MEWIFYLYLFCACLPCHSIVHWISRVGWKRKRPPFFPSCTYRTMANTYELAWHLSVPDPSCKCPMTLPSRSSDSSTASFLPPLWPTRPAYQHLTPFRTMAATREPGRSRPVGVGNTAHPGHFPRPPQPTKFALTMPPHPLFHIPHRTTQQRPRNFGKPVWFPHPNHT